jgi:laccase
MFCFLCTGTWYIHCHFDFHLSMGMVAVFIVDDGSTVDTSLPPPPTDLPKCGCNKGGLDLPVEFYLQNEESRKTVPGK